MNHMKVADYARKRREQKIGREDIQVQRLFIGCKQEYAGTGAS